MNIIKKASVLLLSLLAVLALNVAPALAVEDTRVDPVLILSPQTTLTVAVDGQISSSLSGKHPYGEATSVTAPEVAEKTFLYWANESGEVVSYARTLPLTMYAHTTVGAVYGDSEATPDNLAAFTSISRYGDAIAFCGIGYAADGEVTDSGVLYSTTASTLSELKALSPDEAIERSGNCWTLQVTPEDEDETYYAVAYSVAGGETSYSTVRTVKPSELESGVSFVANLGNIKLPSEGSGAGFCNVTFDANGGEGAMAPQGVVKNQATALRASTFTRKNWRFAGWGTTPDGGVTYEDGQSVTLGENTTLYAQWDQPQATVTKAPKAKSLTYTGSAQELVTAGTAEGGKMQYSLDGKTFSESVPKATKAGTYTVYYKVIGDERHANSDVASVKATIAKASVAKAEVTLKKTTYAYDGAAKEPAVKSVTLGGKKLKAGRDYTVSYKNNKKVGTAIAIVTGQGNYKGTAEATFQIVLARAKLSTVGSIVNMGFSVSWAKVVGAKGYQLQYRKAEGKWRTVTVKGTSKAVSGLKEGESYQLRVRAVAGDRVGAWSKVSARYLRRLKGVSAKVKKAGAVTVTWKADPQANAGYVVLVRYKKDGKIAARANVASGKTRATVSGLKTNKKLWVQVRPIRKSGGKTYAGVLRGTWAK